MAVELGRTDPERWESDRAPKRQQEDIIYELHVKEFSWDGERGISGGVKGNVPRVYCGGYYPVRGWRPPNRNPVFKGAGRDPISS